MVDWQTLLQSARIPVSREAAEGFQVYYDLLVEWNERMDLTSVPKEAMPRRHFLDSLTPLKHPGLIPPDARIIDVGTGAGFPGLPLAIARPDLRLTLLEAQGKRCQFLRAVCQALDLRRVTVIQERAEVLGRAEGHREGYDRAVARAVAPLNVLCEYLLPFVKVGGAALCWKGPSVAREMEDGAAAVGPFGGGKMDWIETGEERGEDRRVIVRIPKIEKTLPQYPRKNGMPAKRPLKADGK